LGRVEEWKWRRVEKIRGQKKSERRRDDKHKISKGL
jgi:hypothetical protein